MRFGRGFGGLEMSASGPPMPLGQQVEFLRDQARILNWQLDQIDARNEGFATA